MNTLFTRLGSIANRFAPWVLLLSILVLTWFAAAFFWFVISPPKAQNLTPLDLPASQSQTATNGSLFSLFPKAKTSNSSNNRAAASFSLHGVFLSSPSSMSAAVLGVDGKVSRYRVGDELGKSGYRLVDVLWDKAVLEGSSGKTVEVEYTKGRLELNQPKPDLNKSKGSTASVKPPASSNRGSSSSRAVAPSSGSGPSGQSGLTKKERLESEMDDAIDQLRLNPGGYLSKMGVAPTGDGYEVTAAMNSKLRSNIGLQLGDKVISVNGQPVGQPHQDAMLLEEVKNTGSAEIQVQRGSQVITIRQQF